LLFIHKTIFFCVFEKTWRSLQTFALRYKMPQDEDLLTESFSARRRCFTIFQRITVVSNIIFSLFAILLIVVGAVSVRELKSYSTLARVSVPAGLIVLGFFLLVIIFLGLYGSFKKNTKFLAAYFLLLLLFVICEFGVGGGAYGLRDNVADQLERSWSYISDQDRNNLQISFGCCGWGNITDNPGSNCAPNITTNSTNNGTATRDLDFDFMSERDAQLIYRQTFTNYTGPCETAIVAYFDSRLYAVGTVGVTFAVLQLTSLLCSIVVCGFIRAEQSRNQDERF